MRDYRERLRELASWASRLEHQLTSESHEAAAHLFGDSDGRRQAFEVISQGVGKSCDNVSGSFDGLAESLGKPMPFVEAAKGRNNDPPQPAASPALRNPRVQPEQFADAVGFMRYELGALIGSLFMARSFPPSDEVMSKIQAAVGRVLKAYDALHLLIEDWPPRHWFVADPGPFGKDFEGKPLKDNAHYRI